MDEVWYYFSFLPVCMHDIIKLNFYILFYYYYPYKEFQILIIMVNIKNVSRIHKQFFKIKVIKILCFENSYCFKCNLGWVFCLKKMHGCTFFSKISLVIMCANDTKLNKELKNSRSISDVQEILLVLLFFL